MNNKQYTELDYPQVIQRSFDEPSDSLNVNSSLKTVYKVGATQTVGALSTLEKIITVGHQALPGDVIRFLTGANAGLERIVKDLNSAGTDYFYLTQALPYSPIGNTYDILRQTSMVTDASGNISVSTAPTTVKQSAYHDCIVDGNITTLAYVQLIASTSSAITAIQILDTTGSWFDLATGAAGSESSLLVVGPGSVETIPVIIPAGTRISIQAKDQNAVEGSFAINLIG